MLRAYGRLPAYAINRINIVPEGVASEFMVSPTLRVLSQLPQRLVALTYRLTFVTVESLHLPM